MADARAAEQGRGPGGEAHLSGDVASNMVEPWRLRVSRWLLAIIVMTSALAVGAVHTVTVCAIALGLGATAVLAWWDAEQVRLRPAARILIWAAVFLTAYTALQCVPVPVPVLATVAPHNADVWSRALFPLHESGPSWAPLSLDPEATRIQVARGTSYILVLLIALRIAGYREGTPFLIRIVIATAVALALAALLHPAFGARQLFGVYQPQDIIDARHIAPLLNPNHLSGYLNLGLCCLLATAGTAQSGTGRIIAGALALLLVATQVWIASRGGVACMVLGIVLVVALLRAHGAGPGRGVVAPFAVMGIAIAGAVLAVVAGSDDAAGELLTADVEKLSIVRNAFRLVPEYGLFGVGRGAFEDAFPRVREAVGYVTVTHPENFVAQWMTEWGVPVAAGGLASIALALRPGVTLSRRPLVVGAWAGLVALAVQNVVDFSSEIPGVVVAAAVCAALVAGGSSVSRRSARSKLWHPGRRGLAIGLGFVGAFGAFAAVGQTGSDLAADRRSLHEAALSQGMSVDRMHAIVRAAMLRHPNEPYLPFMVGVWAANTRDENPLPWLGATLERSPVYGPAHLMLARLLVRTSPAQARLEFRLAAEQAPKLVETVGNEAYVLVGSFDDAIELKPPGANGSVMLDRLAARVQERLPATRVRLDAEIERLSPDDAGPPMRSAENVLSDMMAGETAPWCWGPKSAECLERVLTLARRVERLSPNRCRGYALEARAYAAAGDLAHAARVLDQPFEGVTEQKTCLRTLVDVASAAHDSRGVEDALDRILRSGCSDDQECVADAVYVAQIEKRENNSVAALAAYRRAYEHGAGNAGLLEQMAVLASQAGLHVEAASDYDTLARLRPDDPRWREAAGREHEIILRLRAMP